MIHAERSEREDLSGLLEPDRVVVKDLGEDVERVFEVVTEPQYRLVSLCGADAYARDSAYDPGSLEWWRNGVQYRITARLPTNELLTIGNSMC